MKTTTPAEREARLKRIIELLESVADRFKEAKAKTYAGRHMTEKEIERAERKEDQP